MRSWTRRSPRCIRRQSQGDISEVHGVRSGDEVASVLEQCNLAPITGSLGACRQRGQTSLGDGRAVSPETVKMTPAIIVIQGVHLGLTGPGCPNC